MTHSKHKLTRVQVQQYHRQGWLGPFELITKTEMAKVARDLTAEILEPVKQQGLDEDHYFHNRHLDNLCVWELISNATLVEKVASILGPDLVLWRSNFQIKPPRSEQKKWNHGWNTAAPWHQDCAYYQPSPNVLLSAWIAVDDATKDNGAMRIIPGSHKQLYPHVANPDYLPGSNFFEKSVDPKTIDISKAVDIELQAGEFVLFSESVLHSSPENLSEHRRFGISPRITVPFVDVGDRDSQTTLMLKGKDYMEAYRIGLPPGSGV